MDEVRTANFKPDQYTSEKITKIQELPAYFDPNRYQVDQFFAESFDKTKIPSLL